MPLLKGTSYGNSLYGISLYDNSLYGVSAGQTIIGMNGNDWLKGTAGADYIDGRGGLDTVSYSNSSAGVGVNLATGRGYGGWAEGDILVSIENVFGSNFNDTLIGTSSANQLWGSDGNDVIIGGGGDDRLDGGNGDDILSAGWGHSILDGGYGDDTLKGVGGANTLIGGAGNDTADYSGAGARVTVSLTSGLSSYSYNSFPNDIPAWAVSDHLSGIENVTGSAYDDFLIGDGGVNVLRGMGGGDILDGRAGADIMYGGTGSDAYYVDNAGDVVWEYAGEGTWDAVYARASYALTAGSEIEHLGVDDRYGTTAINLTGNELRNTISGNNGDNIINGGGGADDMNGWRGNDTYIVDNVGDTLFENFGEGYDTVLTSVSFSVGLYSEIEVLQATGTANVNLTGSLDNNIIIGNAGANIIDGSYGRDTLTGGGGADAFIWSNINEIGLTNFDPDIVTDFNRAEGDVLHFTNMDANETVAGNQDFTLIGYGAGFTAPGQITWFTNGTDTFVQLNTNADLTVDGIIRLVGVTTFDGSGIFL